VSVGTFESAGIRDEGFGPFLAACLVVVLNQLDASLTLLWVHTGIAVEANLLWATLVVSQPVMFMVLKLAIVSIGTGVLYAYRDRPLAYAGLLVSAGGYGAVSAWHLAIGSISL